MNTEDKAIKSSNSAISNETKQNTPETSLTSRLSSNVWKTRFDALADLANELSSVESAGSAQTYAPFFKQCLSDSQPWVQEKALDALMVAVEKHSRVILPFLEEIVAAMLEKCLMSTKIVIKDKTMEIVLKVANVEDLRSPFIKIVTGHLAASKIPKMIAGDVRVLIELLLRYGRLAFKLEECVNEVNKCAANSTNVEAKNEALEFYRTASKVFGEEILKYISDLKPAQQEEVKKFIDNSNSIVASNELNKNNVKSSESRSVYEEQKETLSYKFNEVWCSEILALKNWNEKRDKLDELLNVLSNSPTSKKINTELVATLQKLIDDNNVAVIQSALKATTLLIDLLKEEFSPYCKIVMTSVIVHLKDIKTADDALRCLKAISPYIKSEEVIEDIKGALNDKSTTLRVNMCQWLEYFFLLENTRSSFIHLTPILITLLNEPIAYLRESVLTCLAIINLTSSDVEVINIIRGFDEKVGKEISLAIESTKAKYPLLAQLSAKGSLQPTEAAGNTPLEEDKSLLSTVAIEEHKSITTKAENAQELLNQKILNEKLPFYINEALNKPGDDNKLMGLKDLSIWIASNKEKTEEILIPLAWHLNSAIKASRNFILIKEVFVVYLALLELPSSDNELSSIIIPEVIKEMANAEWFDSGLKIVLMAGDCSGPELIVRIVIKKLSTSSKDDNLIESGIDILSRLLDEYEPSILPLKEMFDTAKKFARDENPNIRSAAVALLCGFQRLIGDPIEELLDDLTDEEFEEYDEQLNRCPTPVENKTYRKLKKEVPFIKLTVPDIMHLLFPPVDISSLLPPKFISSMSSSGMKVRQEAKDKLQEIVSTTYGLIQPVGLNQLMAALKERMSDSCKALAKSFIAIVGDLAVRMGTGFKQYSKPLLPSLIGSLTDKQAQIRTETISTINKISSVLGAESIINCFGPVLERDSSEARSEILAWILDNKEAMNKVDSTTLVKGILCCINDKSKEVREKTEIVLALVISLIGIDVFNSTILKFKPAVQNTLKSCIEKFASNEVNQMPIKKEAKSNSGAETAKNAKPHTSKTVAKKIEPNNACPVGSKIIISTIGNKTKRAEQDNSAKWGLNELNKDNVEKLKKMLKPVISSRTFDGMFSGKLKRQQNAATALVNAVKSETEGIIDILDLLFKWITMLLVNQSNMAILTSMIELATAIFSTLIDVNCQLMDFEANSIFPILCERLDTSNVALKEDIKAIILAADEIYSPVKLCAHLVKTLTSKNFKTKAECLGLIKELIKKHGPKAITTKDIKTFGKILATEAQIKTEILGVLCEIYSYKGEGIWTGLAELTDKNKTLLKETFSSVASKPIPKTPPKVCKAAPVVTSDNTLINPIKSDALEEAKAEIVKTADQDSDKRRSSAVEDSKAAQEKGVNPVPLKRVAEELLIEALTNIQSMDDCISALGGKDHSKRADALVFLNGKATPEKSSELAPYMSSLMNLFADVLKEIFASEEYSIKLIKYLLDDIRKLCSIKELAYSIQWDPLSKLMYELLFNMMNIGDVEDLIKALSETIVNIVDKCKPNFVVRSLMKIYSNSKDNIKLATLTMKCLMKFVNEFDTKLPLIGIPDLLMCLHEYLLSMDNDNDLHNEIGTRMAKMIIGKLVRAKKEEIWLQYKVIEDIAGFRDVIIKRWITALFNKNEVRSG